MFCSALVSCEKKPKIEIYLLNRYIESTDGIPVQNIISYDQAKKGEAFELYKVHVRDHIRFDTITGECFSSGTFEAKVKDLQAKPFITDDEIRSFNLHNSNIYFSKAAKKKLYHLPIKPKIGRCHQFAICIDGKPTIFGYFSRISMGRYWPNTYTIRYFDMSKLDAKLKDTLGNDFIFGARNYGLLDSINEKELINAFKKSGRLKI